MDEIIIISFGIAGIVIDVLLLTMTIIFLAKKVQINSVFGYRTSFSMSSKERWQWCNHIFSIATLVATPFLLIIHILVFVFSFLYSWNIFFITFSMFSSTIFILFLIPFIEIIGRKRLKTI